MSKGNLKKAVEAMLAYLNARDGGNKKQFSHQLEEVSEQHRLRVEELEKKLAITEAALRKVFLEKLELEKQHSLLQEKNSLLEKQNSLLKEIEAANSKILEQLKEKDAEIANLKKKLICFSEQNQENPTKPLNNTKNHPIGKGKPPRHKPRGF